MRYLFTGPYPVIASDLSYGPHITVTHTGTGTTAVPQEDGSTVVLHPGDVIELDAPFAHADLHELTGDLADHITTNFGTNTEPAGPADTTEPQKD